MGKGKEKVGRGRGRGKEMEMGRVLVKGEIQLQQDLLILLERKVGRERGMDLCIQPCCLPGPTPCTKEHLVVYQIMQ
jgi:hypothetical protein